MNWLNEQEPTYRHKYDAVTKIILIGWCISMLIGSAGFFTDAAGVMV